MLLYAQFVVPRGVALAPASSCASELHVSGRCVFVGDMRAFENGMRSSGECALFDMCFAVPRAMLLSARLYLRFWVAHTTQDVHTP